MKKKKSVLNLFLLFAGLTIGFGYAAITDAFNIGGDIPVSVDQSNFKCMFVAADSYCVSDSKCASYSFSNDANDKTTKATLTFSAFTTIGDTGEAYLTVQNQSTNLYADLGSITIDNNSYSTNYFTVTAEWNTNTMQLGINGSNQIHIKVVMIRTPTETLNNQKLNISFTASAVEIPASN